MHITMKDLVSFPEEILLKTCEKVSESCELSDLLNLRLTSQQLNRIY